MEWRTRPAISTVVSKMNDFQAHMQSRTL